MATARTAKSALIRILDQSTQPVFILDDKRQIIFVNQACCDWSQISLEKLTELECRYHSSEDADGPELIAAALCPPGEVFEGKVAKSLISIPIANGKSSSRWVTFHPISDGAKVNAILGLVGNCDSVASDAELTSQLPSTESLHAIIQNHRATRYRNVNLAKWVGNGTHAKQIQIKIESAIRAYANTLIVGPRGVGKEHLANLIHEASRVDESNSKVEGKILKVDCKLADQESIQDTVRYLGRFGTPGANRILLKRVELLSEPAQQELLGFLEMPAFQLTIISTLEQADDSNIEQVIDNQLLAYLEGIRIDLPSLSQRVDDIPYLAQLFVEQLNHEEKKQCFGFEPDAVDALMLHDWPGNLNELAQVVRDSFKTCTTSRIKFDDLPRDIHVAMDAHAVPEKNGDTVDLDQELYRLEKQLIDQAMQKSKGNKAKAARMLGINRARLLRRIEHFQHGESYEAGKDENDQV